MNSAAWLVLLAFTAEPLSFEQWMLRGTAALPESPPVKTLARASAAAELGIRANLEEAPWSITSALAHAQYFPRPDAMSPDRRWDARAIAEVRYQLRSRLIATLAGSVDLGEAAGLTTGQPEVTPFAVQLQLSYDVLRGSSDSAENQRARAAAVRSLAAKLENEARIVAAELSYAALLAELYANACKLQALDALARPVAQSLSEAKIQLEARVLSPSQFMNYQHLDNLVRSQRADLDSQRAALIALAAAWGPGAAAAAENLAAQALSCAAPASSASSASSASAASPGAPAPDATQLAKSLPALAAARAAEWAAALDLAAIHTERGPSLSPYVAGRFSRDPGSDRELAAAELGLLFDWDVAGTKGALLEETARELHLSAALRVEETLAAESAGIQRLDSDARTAAASIAALSATIANTDKLAAALEVQRAIGEVDALNQTTAVVNSLSAKLALIDAWARRELSSIQLQALASAARRYQPELERLEAQRLEEKVVLDR